MQLFCQKHQLFTKLRFPLVKPSFIIIYAPITPPFLGFNIIAIAELMQH